jgi:hypothetical protein
MAPRPKRSRSRKRKSFFSGSQPQPSEALANTAHFLLRVEERLNSLNRRKQKRFRLLYDALSKDEARTASLHGRYAFQFGGEPRRQGDYLVAEVRNGRTTGFITLLVNQFVPHQQGTRVVSAKSIMPPTSAYKNPSPLSQLAARRQQEAENSLGVPLPVSWDIGPYKHFRNPRGFGVTFTHHKNPKWATCHVRLSKKLLDSDVGRQDGIIQHELGHVIDIMVIPDHLDRWALKRGVKLPPQKLGELRADAIAHAVWGKPMLYDTDTVQSTTNGDWPRPKHLGW